MKPLNIAFMGTPDFSVHALDAIYRSKHKVKCVYSQPPRPKGRGNKVQLTPVHAFAEERKIPVFTPETLKTPEAQEEFKNHNLDVAVVAAYGLILPEAVLNAPEYGCLNIHASLLPRWRGASPIQRAILAGDKYSGVTIMQMDKGLDTGAMIEHAMTPISHDTTASTLHDELAKMGADLIMTVLNNIAENGKLNAEPQNDEQATYAHLLSKDDGNINWEQSAVQISRQIRALNPWPGTRTARKAQKFKIMAAQKAEEKTDKPSGTILDRLGHVACGQGTVLKILKIQPDGKQAMDFISALNGGYLENGQVFEPIENL